MVKKTDVKKPLAKEEAEEVAVKLYKQNIEVAERNKVLSLLRKLYQLVIQTTEPVIVADQIAHAILREFEFELVGISLYKSDKDELMPLRFAVSERFEKAASSMPDIQLLPTTIVSVSENEIFETVISGKSMLSVDGLIPIWQGISDLPTLKKIGDESHIVSSLLYPLTIGEKMIGVLLICVNRRYDQLTNFEKESIESFINIISVALDRAFLYKDIEDANVKLKALDQLKNEFLAFAAHQLKAPLAAIKGFATMIGDGTMGAVPDPAKDVTQKITTSSNRLLALVSNFLDLEKIESGKLQLKIEDVNFGELVTSVFEELKFLAVDKKPAPLTYTLENNLKAPVILKADAQYLRQVIQNFIDNSIKYTPSGFVKVRIVDESLTRDKEQVTNNDRQVNSHMSNVKGQSDTILFSVSDSGIGISKELIPKLFGKFSRVAGDADAAKIQGTGLGLYIAKFVVDAYHGEMWAESPGEGKGATFNLRLKKS